MKKKIFLFIISFLLLVLLSGCADITYGFYIEGNGQVVRKYTVVIDPEWSFGAYDADYALTAARAELEKLIIDSNRDYAEIIEEEPYTLTLIFTYDSLTEYYISLGYTGNERPEESRDVVDKEMFFTYTTREMYDHIDSLHIVEISEQIRDDYFPLIEDMPYQDILISLEYGTKYTKAITANTEDTSVVNRMRIFRWSGNIDSLDNVRTITIRQPNLAVWYALAAGASIIFGLLLYLIMNYGRKPKNAGQ